MSERFQNKYRIPSARLQNWDYSRAGAYFITICTQNRENYFGNIIDGKMELSPIGVIADIMWHEIKNHTKDIELDAFVVMPNHVHGILILNDDDMNAVETLHATSLHQSASSLQSATSTQPATPTQQQSQPSHNQFMASISPKSYSVSTIIRSYKSAVSKHAHRLGYDFAWQPRFYDSIIRDDISLKNTQKYIIDNPLHWENNH